LLLEIVGRVSGVMLHYERREYMTGKDRGNVRNRFFTDFNPIFLHQFISRDWRLATQAHEVTERRTSVALWPDGPVRLVATRGSSEG
jgi:hypothetical protein